MMAVIEKTMRAIDQSRELTEDDKQFFINYHIAMNTEEMPPEAKNCLSVTIIQKSNDKNFECRIIAFEKEMSNIGAEFPYLDLFKTLSCQIPLSRYFDYFIKKAQIGLNIVSMGGGLGIKDKLTLSELDLLQVSKNLKRCFDIFANEKGVNLSLDPKYNKIKQQCETITELERHIDELVKSNVLQSGDVYVTNKEEISSSSTVVRDEVVNDSIVFKALKNLVTEYAHAAQLATTKQGKIVKSHMWGTHKIEDFSMHDLIRGKVFRVDVRRLQNSHMPKEQWAVIEGENLQERYAAKVAIVANNELLQGLTIIGGLESACSILPHWFNRDKKVNFGLFETDNEKTILYKKRMICSDFVAREIVTAIILLNQELKEKVLTTMRETNPSITIADIPDPINSPFAHGVNFSRIHPEELIMLLRKAGCISPVEVNTLHALINTQIQHQPLSAQTMESP